MARFIWPTTRGWVLALSGIIWLLVAMVNHTLIALLIAWTAIGLTIASLISALFSLHGFRVKRGPADQATAGQIINLSLTIENPKWRRRQAIAVEEELPFALENPHRALIPPISRRSSQSFDRPVLAIRRGDFKLNAITLRGGDPAGLFYRETTIELPASVIIYPPIEPVSDLLLHQREATQATTGDPISAAGTSQDFFGVREYNHADGMRYIHWRSSAKFGKFMVKEFERNAVMSVAVLLDAHEQQVSDGSWSNLEYLIRAAASLSYHCSGLYCSFAFAAGGTWPTVFMPKPASQAHPQVMYTLATLTPGNVHLHTVFEDLGRALPGNTVVFCLSLSADSLHLRTALETLVEQGMDVRWYYASKKAFSQPKRGRRVDAASSTPHQASAILTPIQLTPDMSLAQALTISPGLRRPTAPPDTLARPVATAAQPHA